MINEKDKRRYRLYQRRNRYGRRIYRMIDLAQKEGVTRQAIYISLKKFVAK
jgi:hypothetical protein